MEPGGETFRRTRIRRVTSHDRLQPLNNMYAKAVTGTPTKDAIAWAEGEMRRVYERASREEKGGW